MPDPISAGAAIAVGAGAAYGLGDAIFGSDEPSDWQKGEYLDQKNYQRWAYLNNIETQREFAKHGVRWRVEDAKAAGIHPVVALGSGGASFAPQSVGDIGVPSPGPSRGSRVADAMGDLGRAGQNISRAVKSGLTETERQQIQMNELQLEGMKLDNAMKSQRLIQGSNQTSQVAPARPEEVIIQPEVTYHKTKGGGLAPAPSEAFADRAEDQLIPSLAWAARNMIFPEIPDRQIPKGHEWFYNPVRAEWTHSKPEDQGAIIKAYNAVRKYKRGK